MLLPKRNFSSVKFTIIKTNNFKTVGENVVKMPGSFLYTECKKIVICLSSRLFGFLWVFKIFILWPSSCISKNFFLGKSEVRIKIYIGRCFCCIIYNSEILENVCTSSKAHCKILSNKPISKARFSMISIP